MTDELPKFSRVELALGERVGKIAAPMINQGMALEEALTGAYPIAARQLIDAGEDAQEVEAALARQLASQGVLPEQETLEISKPLHAALMESFEDGLITLPEGPVRLDEVTVKANTGFKMVLYPNESQHAGFPHVKVQLQDGDINISIEEEPRVVAGKRSLRGEAAALRAVKDHKKSLLEEWHATRPDDQKLPKPASSAPPKAPNTAAHKVAIAGGSSHSNPWRPRWTR
ncbi:DUF4160 domain-containing protein [Mesorhizobium sp. M0184]|uniref:DUF4160 domain-containing protein n=1 Tax=unclassified Mesorhizobium TaxID=325217 RepID=UPI003335A553